MARTTTPSFVRDPDQAAELAAQIRDAADYLQRDYEQNRDGLTRAQRAQIEQTIARYRRWADELDPPADEAPARPTHIRPARESLPQAASDG
jgi:hypothetical protein